MAPRQKLSVASVLFCVGVIVGCGGGGSGGQQPAPPPAQPSFAVAVSPSTSQGSPLVISWGAIGSEITVNVTGQNGFAGTVNLSVAGLPAGVTASPASWTESTTQTQKVVLTAGTAAVSGTFQATISGSSGPLTSSAVLAGKVAIPQIAWSRDQLARIMIPGSTATETVRFRSDSDLSNLDVTASPELSATVQLSPTHFDTISANTDYAVTIAIQVSSAASEGDAFGGSVVLKQALNLAPAFEVFVRADVNSTRQSDPAMIVTDGGAQYPANEVLLALFPGSGDSEAQQLAASFGGTIVGVIRDLNLYQVLTPTSSASELQALIDKVRASPPAYLQAIGENLIMGTPQAQQPTDLENLANQPGGGDKVLAYEYMGVQRAWQLLRNASPPSTTTCRVSIGPYCEVRVGLIDTGLDKQHQEFDMVRMGSSKKIDWIDTAGCTFDPKTNSFDFAQCGHGTEDAGIIGASNRSGVGLPYNPPEMNGILSGIPNYFLPGSNDSGYVLEPRNWNNANTHNQIAMTEGTLSTPQQAGAKTVLVERQILRDGLSQEKIIAYDNLDVPEWSALFRRHPEALFVLPAGNFGTWVPVYSGPPTVCLELPACINLPNTISVLALDPRTHNRAIWIGTQEPSSDFGPAVEIAASGSYVYAPQPTYSNLLYSDVVATGRFCGTSAAAPFVAGAAAMIEALNGQNLSGQDKKSLLLASAVPVTDQSSGPRLNICRAARRQLGLPDFYLTGFSVSDSILLNFSAPVSGNNVDNSVSVTIAGTSTKVTGLVAVVNQQSIWFTPATPFQAGTQYQVDFGAVTNIQGVGIDTENCGDQPSGSTSFTFTAGAGTPALGTACSINGSTSPATGMVGIYAGYSAGDPTPGSGYTCAWKGAFGMPAGSSCAYGYTPTDTGIFSESVTVSNGGNSVTLGCPALTVQGFSLSVDPASATAIIGGSPAKYAVIVSSINGFSAPVTLSWMGTLPAGVSVSLDDPSSTCTVPAGGSCSVRYTVTAGLAASGGDTQITFFGSNGSMQRTANAALHIQTPPALIITSLAPDHVTAGGAAFTLTINGTGFQTTTVAQWNGTNLTTTFVSAMQLQASVPAADIAATGTAQITVSTPGGGVSNPAVFTITPPVPATPDKFAYVVNMTCAAISGTPGCVYAYSIDPVTGALTRLGSPVPAGNSSQVLAAALGKFLYVANMSDVSMFSINATTGALTPIPPGTVVGGFPEWIGVHPSGKFAFLANDDTASMDVFAINSTTGALTKTTSASACINSMRNPGVSAGLDPSGKFAYVPQGCSFQNVLTFSIDQNTGVLTQTSAANGPFLPVATAVHPTGTFAYVVGSSPDAVTVYRVDSAGNLSPVSSVNTGSMPSAIAIEPAGKFAYIANYGSNNLYEYNIDQTTGALSKLPDVSVLNTPVALTIERSGRFLYAISASDSSCAYGLGASVQAFTIDTAGRLTATGSKVCADLNATGIVTTSPAP